MRQLQDGRMTEKTHTDKYIARAVCRPAGRQVSTYNQKQAHAEYEIVSITSSQIACIANIYSQNNVSKLRRMKGRHEEDH